MSNHPNIISNLSSIIRVCNHALTSEDARRARSYLSSRIKVDDQIGWKFGFWPSRAVFKDCNVNIGRLDFSSNPLVLPIYDQYNNISGIIGRKLPDTDSRYKYIYSNNFRSELILFGLNKARESIINNNCVICVEGQYDCIALHSVGITNTVALGTNDLSIWQLGLILRLTDNIILMLDNDNPGQHAKNVIINKYSSVNIKSCKVPKDYKDIDEFLLSSDDKKKQYITFLKKKVIYENKQRRCK